MTAEVFVIKNVIVGADSPDTAYMIDDYPYGRRLRCQMRVWIETNPRYGQRAMRQTTNPKRAGTYWNKPKKGTYSDLKVMYIDEKGHVKIDGLNSSYSRSEEIAAWIEKYRPYVEDSEWVVKRAITMLRGAANYDKLPHTWVSTINGVEKSRVTNPAKITTEQVAEFYKLADELESLFQERT